MSTDPSARPASPPVLEWTDDGAPRSARFGDVYFSRDDGLAESRAVFLQGCDLPNAWAGRKRFTVAELGFGTGLNVVALLDLWRRTKPAEGRLHVFTIEAFPLTAEEAARALSAWPEMAEIAAPLLAAWPAGTAGFHRIDLPEFSAVIDLAIGEVDWALSQWSGPADAWFLDGFSPALNPDMWSNAVMSLIAARSAPDARLATFTVAGAVRRGLSDSGFAVDKRPGHGRKRERLEARLTSPPADEPAPSVVVIGAGVAGASVVRALKEAGLAPTLIEADRPGAGGSGFPAALVTPRLDAGDALIAGFHAQALEYARNAYHGVPDAVIAEHVLQLEQAPRDATRFAKVAAQPIWPTGEMTTLSPAQATAALGETLDVGGLRMDGALTVAPASILAAWLDAAAPIKARAASLEKTAEGWRVLAADGALIAEAQVVVVTAGWGAGALLPELDLRPVRGQADWVEGSAPAAAVAWGGYAAPTESGFLYGATHDRDDVDATIRAEDSRRNLDTLAARLPGLAASVAGRPAFARAAVRATTRDRLPVCGPLPGQEGLLVIGGLGSRGFCVAPLLGAHVAALIAGAPSPLPSDMARRLEAVRLIASAGLPAPADG